MTLKVDVAYHVGQMRDKGEHLAFLCQSTAYTGYT